MSHTHLVFHGLAIKKHADPHQVARLVVLDPTVVAGCLRSAQSTGRVVEVQGKFALAPLARIALEADYSRQYADIRQNPKFMSAYESFERINLELKALITDWQTIVVAGERVLNDHSDRDHDARIINRIGELHERADAVLAELSRALPRIDYYRRSLLAALEKSEDGALQWVSDATQESYHTLWFELHEDLLRIVGCRRME